MFDSQTKKLLISVTAVIIIMFVAVYISLSSYTNIATGESSSANSEVKVLNEKISENKDKVDDIKKQQEKYSQLIQEQQKKQASLKNQVGIIENRIKKAELNVEKVKEDIGVTNLEIQRTQAEIASKSQNIAKNKERIASILQLLYKQDRVDALQILLMNDSLSEFLDRIKYLQDINKKMKKSVDVLKDDKEDLTQEKTELERKQEEMKKLREELEKRKVALEDEKENKKFLIEQTKNSEQRYSSLLTKAKQEQQQAQVEIASLEKKVRQKLKELSKDKLEFNDAGLIWPISGDHTITATFHDPNYPFRYLFEHPAIDLRTSFNTTIKVAASGYVARVNINGPSYGYIMIVHGDGISTVYGHVNKSYVSEDEYVIQGQTIGLSGGLPGTRGAGYLTTGPHLHFEVRKNGIPVNPLEYLGNNYYILD